MTEFKYDVFEAMTTKDMYSIGVFKLVDEKVVASKMFPIMYNDFHEARENGRLLIHKYYRMDKEGIDPVDKYEGWVL